MGPKARKRRRSSVDEGRVDCPFTIKTEQASNQASKKSKHDDGNRSEEQLAQLSPFKPEGDFTSSQTMNLLYSVEPRKRWRDMTRYHQFILNGHKYRTDDFVYIANDDSIEAQKAARRGQDRNSLPELTMYWVARILEIRAVDENHVYARIYWMYSPDELPPNTQHGKEMIEGRQPYHGKDELIASNHMDIINVVSVVAKAQVRQWIESNDEEAHDALYWRQAFNLATLQLSSARMICNCQTPAHPDELLVYCANQSCEQWLHEKCLRHAALKRVYDQLGTGKPHSKEHITNKTVSVTQKSPPRSLTNDGNDLSNPRPSEMGKATGSESYNGLFTAKLKMRDGPMHWEIGDQRQHSAGNNGTWQECVCCLICGSVID